jgi:hypothetical protein
MTRAERPNLFPPQSSIFQPFELTPSQLDLVWEMNRELTRREFDYFVESSRALGLNPFKRQICAIVFKGFRDCPRHVAIVTTIAGLRALADRTGTYRPDPKPARIVYDQALVHPRGNPLGISDCTATPYRFAFGKWHRVAG